MAAAPMTNRLGPSEGTVGMFEGLFQPMHLLCLVFVVGVVLLAVFLSRRGGATQDRISALEEENDRLREEIEKLKKRQ
jgi:hypothetical protein